MLILLLLALVRLSTLFRGLSADDSGNSTVDPLVLHLDSCPDKASFFRREETESAVPGPCQLCFCKDSGTAECWPRDSWRCDVELRPHPHKDEKFQRSPVDTKNVFFQDATINKKRSNSTDPLLLKLDSCRSKESFFKRVETGSLDPGACYFCFCKDGGTAACWLRDSWRCDLELRQPRKKDARVRRSPLGFGDIFFRDAARDMFNKREPEQCKPFGGSYSEGCPPEDWCLGCTVCDCDANGHWDCHVLSFCDDEKDGKKQIKKRYKGALRRGHKRRRISTTPRTEVSTTNKAALKPKKNNKLFKMTKKAIASHKVLKRTPRPNTKRNTPYPKPKPKLKAPKTTILRKNVATKKPITVNSVNTKPVTNNNNKDDKAKYTKDIVQNVMKAVNTMIVQKIENKTKALLAQRMVRTPCPNNRKKQRVKVKEHAKRTAFKSKKPVNSNPRSTFVKKVLKRKALSGNTTKEPNTRKFVRNKRALFNYKLSDTNYTTPNHLENMSVLYSKNTTGDISNSGTVFVNTLFPEITIPEKKDFIYTLVTTTQVYSDSFVTNRNESVLKHIKDKQSNKSVISDEVEAIGDSIDQLTFNDTRNKYTEIHNNILEVNEIEPNLKTIHDNQINNSFVNYNMKYNANSTNSDGAYNEVKIFVETATVYNNLVLLKTNESDLKVIFDNHLNQSFTVNETEVNKMNNTFRVNVGSLSETVSNSTDINFNKWPPFKYLEDKIRRLWHDIIKIQRNNTSVQGEVANVTNNYKLNHRLNSNKLESLKNIFPNTAFVYKVKSKPERNTTLNLRESHLKHINNDNNNNVEKKQTIGDRWAYNWLKRNKTNTRTTIRPRMKNFNVLRYLKKFFRNIFSLDQRQEIKHLRKNSVLKILCKYFRRCKINSKNMAQLEIKIKELNTEANKILRIINIVKGLLRLLDFDENGENIKGNNNNKSNNSITITDDIEKLNAILKGNYEKNVDKLSDAQIRQVDYIKNNTQEFVKSIGKFSTILSEIIYTTRIHTNIHDKKRGINRNLVRLPRDYKEFTAIDQPLSKLKYLLLTYNLIENNFLRQVFEALHNLETKYSRIGNVGSVKVSSRNLKENYAESIETLTRNIIDNLRKLKKLAMSTNSSGRSKRSIMPDDGGVEYLLTLMEYLIRNHYTTEVKAVNDVHDGIDLLLEAIRNAPDIKHTQKKVLESLPRETMHRISVLSTTMSSTTTDVLKERFSTFHSMNPENNFNLTSDLNDAKVPELSLDYEEVDDKRRNYSTKEFSTDMNFTELNIDSNINSYYNNQTEMIYYEKETTIPVYYVTEDPESNDTYYAENNKFGENNYSYVDNDFHKAFDLQLSTTEKDNAQVEIDITTAKAQAKEMVIEKFERTTSERSDVIEDVNEDVNEDVKEVKKYEVFVADIEEDDVPVKTAEEPQMIAESTTSIVPNTVTETVMEKFKPMKMRHYLPDLEDVSISDNRPKKEEVNWIDEVYDQEFKEYVPAKSLRAPLHSTTETVTRTSRFVNHVNNIRSIKVEKASSNQGSLPTAEDIMRKKQLELLNSLDYGTEKFEIETETKHGTQDDWSSADGFSTYFV